MMIKRLYTPQQVLSILSVPLNDRRDILMWAVRNVESPKCLVMVGMEKNKVFGFLVAGIGEQFNQEIVCNVMEAESSGDGETHKKVFELVQKWALAQGATSFEILTKRPKAFIRRWGFQEKGTLLTRRI